jgi:DNA-binding response OmpR family regulator
MRKRILIVDDEAEFVELARYRLADERYEFEFAQRGMDGLNKASLFQADLILLDVLLPDLDGLTLCEISNRQPGTGLLLETVLTETPASKIAAADLECVRG